MGERLERCHFKGITQPKCPDSRAIGEPEAADASCNYATGCFCCYGSQDYLFTALAYEACDACPSRTVKRSCHYCNKDIKALCVVPIVVATAKNTSTIAAATKAVT